MAEKAEIEYDPHKTSPLQLCHHISDIGFEASIIAEAGNQRQGILELTVCLTITDQVYACVKYWYF